jgi:hypothetical protein
MKYRIFGTILVLAILGALFIVTQDPGTQQAQPGQPVPQQQPEDNGLKGLKIQ